MIQETRVYAVIHLDAIAANIKAMKETLPPCTQLMGIIKADGYGHGAVPAAQVLEPYVVSYGVATIEEAKNLRAHKIEKPILVLGVIHKSRYKELVEGQIRGTVFTWEQAKELSDLADSLGKKAVIHLAVDTGMSRIGMPPDWVHADLVKEITLLPGIVVEGLFTHFACADETDKASANKQLKYYLDFIAMLEDRGIKIPVKHCANSAGIIDLPASHLDVVRAGIAIYGLYPSQEVNQKKICLQPALEWKARISHVKTIEAGCGVSYGSTFVAKDSMSVATIPVGYADGYPRNLSSRGYVLIHGKRANILGRICMDQFMVDVTHIPEAAVDDVVTLIGTDGAEQLLVEDMARMCGGFHYEIVCGISKRVPRIYVFQGDVVGYKDYALDPYPELEIKRELE